MVASVVALWALLLGLVPWLLESPDSLLYVLGVPGDQFGNIGAIWLVATVIGSMVLPFLIACHYAGAMNAIGLASLISDGMAGPAPDEDPGVWRDRFADRHVLDAVGTLKGRAEKVDAADIDDPAWPELQDELRARLERLDSAMICYLLNVQVRARELADMPLDDLAQEDARADEARVAARLAEEFRPASEALTAAYGTFSSLLGGLTRAPVSGVARASALLGGLDEDLEAAERVVYTPRAVDWSDAI